jgi:hypothetical protein
MAEEHGLWQLELGGVVVATLAVEDYEFPWTYARIVSAAGFNRFRPYFSDEDARPYFSDEDARPESAGFDTRCAEVRASGGFRLRDLASGRVYSNLRLQQEGDIPRFRYAEVTHSR